MGGGFGRGIQDIADRQHNNLLHLFDRALADGIKMTDRLDGVTEKVKAQRNFAARGENVDDSSANAIFANLLNQG